MDIEILENTQPKHIWGVSFAAGKLAAGGNRGFDVWDVASRQRILHHPSHAVANGFFGCQQMPDGRLLVSDTNRGFRVLQNDGSLQELPGSPYEKHVRDLELSLDGQRLILSRGGAGRSRIECWQATQEGSWVGQWSLSEGQLIDPAADYTLKESVTIYGAVSLATDKPWLCHLWEANPTLPNKITLVVRPLETPLEARELGQTRTAFPSKLMRRFRDDVAVVWDPVSMERWDLQTGESTHFVEVGRSSLVAAVMHPTQPWVVTVTGNGKAQRRAIADLSLIDELSLGVGKVLSLAVSDDGLLAAGSTKGLIALWAYSD